MVMCFLGLHSWKQVLRFEPTEVFCYGDPDWLEVGKVCRHCRKRVNRRRYA